MKRAALVLFLACSAMLGFAQIPGGGIQFSGVLSANVIDDFNSNTAYSDNNSGYTYLQLTGSFKDGPFGLESQLQFGPAQTGTSNLFVHYGYGYANMLNRTLYVAVGRVVDLSTFGLISFYQQTQNGPGVYGNAVGKAGSSGFGLDGVELRIAPMANLIFGIVMPYNINPFPIVNSTLKATRFTASYTVPKLVQVVLGYQQHAIGVADYITPPLQTPPIVDTNLLLNENKLYALANLLVSDNLTAGLRYELDHDVSTVQIISNNVYATLGGKIGDFSIGGDVGVYVPPGGSAGLEALGASWYTFASILPSVDLQPYVQVVFLSRGYPLVSDLPGVVYGGPSDACLNINPQLKLLLGKSQHELVLGYSVTYDMSTAQIILDQLNVMMQIYF